jgi:hypothetical protein
MATKAEIQRQLKSDIAEINRKLLKIQGRIVDKNQARAAQKKAAAPLIDEMYRRSPSKGLADSIEIFEPSRGKNTFVGPNYKKGGQLAYIFEYGTVDRYKKTGQHTGIMDKKPFIKPAYNATRIQVFSNLKNEYEKLLSQAIRDNDSR